MPFLFHLLLPTLRAIGVYESPPRLGNYSSKEKGGKKTLAQQKAHFCFVSTDC